MEILTKKTKTCKRLINGNAQCRCKPMKDSEFCYWHNPEIPDNLKQETRAKGGKSPKRKKFPYSGLTKFTVNSDEEIPQLIIDVMNEYRAGMIHKETAVTLTGLINVLVKAYSQKNSKLIEEIISKLEEQENYSKAG